MCSSIEHFFVFVYFVFKVVDEVLPCSLSDREAQELRHILKKPHVKVTSGKKERIGHFTGVDLALIETSQLFLCKFVLISMKTTSLL